MHDTRDLAAAGPRWSQFGIVTLAAIAVLAVFWFRPGLDMYPLDDGWVPFSADSLDFDWPSFIWGAGREARLLPYLFARAVESDGFVTINLILIALDTAILVGLFAIFHRLLRGRATPAFIAACVATLFPGDPTMFWLGAFGVNISFALLVWATYLNLRAIDSRRIGY